MSEGDAHHVLTILAVEDLSISAAFYRAAFPSWSVTVETPVYVELALPGAMRFGLYARTGFARNVGGTMPVEVPRSAIGPAEIYLRVGDLDASIARLRGAGARELSARAARDWGDEAAYFADPDGHVLVVSRPL